MRIPRDFDRWMFDYKEGNLSQTEMTYFEQFIANNPQHNTDVEAWDQSFIQNHNMSYPGMKHLLKERKTFNWIGWAASLVLFLSVLSSLYLFTSNNSNVYQLRNFSNLNSFDFNANQLNLFIPSNIKDENLKQNNKKTQQNNQSNISKVTNSNTANFIVSNLKYKQNYYSYRVSEINNKRNNKNKIDVELNKISLANHNLEGVGLYFLNPKFKSFDKNKIKKSKSNYGSIAYKLKKLYKNIEKMAGYPIGLINLYDPEILTPNNNLLTSNFGFVGSFGKPRFEMKYRNQWFGGENNLQSSFINFDTYVKALKSGVGVVLNHQNFNQGAFSDYNVSIIYSPKFQITKNIFFEPAVKLSMGLLTVNTSKLNLNNTYEVARGKLITYDKAYDNTIANNVWYKDYGLGFLINAKKFYIGLNADNIAKHNQPVYGDNVRAGIKYTAMVGVDYQSRNKKMILSPFITYTKQNLLSEFWVGANIKYNWLTFGGAYSSLNDYSASLGVKFRNFKLIYQYDKTVSFINNDRFVSHNLGVRINAKQKRKR